MPTRQQGGGENRRPRAQPVQKAENSCVFTTPETQRSIDFSLFFSDRLPTLHLPFPSQPCGHKESSISVNRIKCSIEPASHSILRDTLSAGLNKAPKPLNLTILAQFLLFSVRKSLLSGVHMTRDVGWYWYGGPFSSYSAKTLDLTLKKTWK